MAAILNEIFSRVQLTLADMIMIFNWILQFDH